MEISPENLERLVERISELYVSYRKRYVLCLPGGRLVTPKRKGELYSVLTNNVLKNHLLQKYAVAIFAGPKTSRFVCFDIDDGKKVTVTGVVNALEESGFPREQIYVSFSGGKGYHVEIFFDQLVSTYALKELYEQILERTGFSAHQVEFRPAHGSAIKLPLSVHARTGNMCWFVDQETLEPIERYEYLFEIQQISADILYRPLAKKNTQRLPTQRGSSQSAVDCSGGCRRMAVSNAAEDERDVQAVGTRHNLMRNIAVHLRLTGKSRSLCEEALLQWYEQQDKTLIHSSREEVLADIQDLLDWVFSDRFKLQTSSSQDRVKVTATDMKLVVSAASRSMKRVLFLLLIRSAAGKNAISIAEIAAVTGISRKSANKAICRLLEQNLLQYEPGARIMTNEGYYASERNRYKIPHYMGRRIEASVELDMSDVMKRFNDCYHHAIAQLLTDYEISRCFPLDEQTEHREFIDMHEENGCERLDLCGKKISFSSEEYGEIEAYDLGNR